MVKEKADKLKDFLEGFFSIEYSGIFPIGAVLIEENDRARTLDTIKDKKITVYENDIPRAENTPIAASLSFPPSLKIKNYLRGFLQGRGPVKKILLVLTKDLYDNDKDLPELVSSACRL